MNPNPEQDLQRFRLPAPSPALRARVLAAARLEWSKPAPVSAWWTLRRPLLAVAAALVLVFAANWTNHRLTSPFSMASAIPPPDTGSWMLESIGLPPGMARGAFVVPFDPAALAAARQIRRIQILEMENLFVVQPPASDGQTRWFRQNPPASASCG